MKTVLVIQTGVANTASVLAAIARAGGRPKLTEKREEVRNAEFVVLPGVGAFKAGMNRLQTLGLVEVIRERVLNKQPTLAICLGLQLLADASEENPGIAGIGVIGHTIKRFENAASIPQIGWNKVLPSQGCRFLTEGYAYFANSFCLTETPQNWQVAIANRGVRFIAALEAGPVLACQFHPELSGAWGLELLRRWLTDRE